MTLINHLEDTVTTHTEAHCKVATIMMVGAWERIKSLSLFYEEWERAPRFDALLYEVDILQEKAAGELQSFFGVSGVTGNIKYNFMAFSVNYTVF